VAEIIAVLEIYATPPTLGDWGAHWLAEATAALPKAQPKETKETEDEETEPIERPVKGKLSALDVALRKQLAMRFGLATGVGTGAMPALTRLESQLKELDGRRRDLMQHPQAHLATGELRELRDAVSLVHGLGVSLKSLIEKGDFPNLLAFDTEPMEQAFDTAVKVEKRVVAALKELDEISSETSDASASLKKPFSKPKGDSAKKREGGVDGIFDPGFDPGTMATWVKRIKRAMDDKNVGDCVGYIQVFKGRGGGTSTSYGGRTVFHISHGFSEGGDGCTLFFTQDDDGVITIVAIGSHDNRYTTAYRIDWQLDGWSGGDWHINTLILKR
jgi:hypothetical protein